MTRYQVLRKLGCDWFTAGGIAFMHYMLNYPEVTIGFMNVIIEYDPKEVI